ncbi:MAG TPA: FimV/HubP family polar landmark protein, partial [Candidatus Berkiella sp.]|nr:FimV/HubP family polar landmark protein [Candidatus Berkiella sp.]
HSHLNEPLEADIPIIDLKGVDPSDVIVTVADQQAYEQSGLQPIGWLTSIRFQVIKGEIAGRPVLKLKTKGVVKDPFVDLLIEVKWPNGKLLREYTLLLDPPKSVIPTTRPTQNSQNIIPAVTAEEVESYAALAPRCATRQLETIPGTTYGPIANESLWSIARSLALNMQSDIHQTVMAIAEKNPHAFRNGNINCMRSGVVLNLPDKAELEKYSKAQSQSYVATQGKVSLPQTTKTPVAKAPQKPLTLVAPIQSLEPAEKLAGKPENQSGTERLNLIEEAVDTLKRSNEDITKKNQSLQDQNQSLEKLLSMKEEEIKKLVEMVKQSTQSNENIPQGQFAIAVSDIPQKPKEEVLESLPFASMVPAKPFLKQADTPHKIEQPTTIKVDNTTTLPASSNKAISADELSKPKQQATPTIQEPSGSKGTYWLLLLLGGLSALGIMAWKRR